MNTWLLLSLTTLILVSCFFDLKTRRIPNAFNLIVLGVCFTLGLYQYGLSSLYFFAIATICFLPLYLLGALGGGDFKLFCALSFCFPLESNYQIFKFTLFWATLFAMVKLVLSIDFKNIQISSYLKMKELFSKKKSDVYKLPFTLPYFLGWLSFLRLGGFI